MNTIIRLKTFQGFSQSTSQNFLKNRENSVRMTVEKEITKIATYLKIPVKGKISYTEDNIIQLAIDGKVLVGFATILNYFHNSIEKDKNYAEFFLTKQWFDFANIFIRSTCKRDKYAACLELNEYLETRSYLIGQKLTLADLAVFFAISDIIKQLHPLEKESYLNLSRWFDHLQQMGEIRQSSDPINFSTIHLLGWNSSRA